jgi:hypothetical protein
MEQQNDPMELDNTFGVLNPALDVGELQQPLFQPNCDLDLFGGLEEKIISDLKCESLEENTAALEACICSTTCQCLRSLYLRETEEYKTIIKSVEAFSKKNTSNALPGRNANPRNYFQSGRRGLSTGPVGSTSSTSTTTPSSSSTTTTAAATLNSHEQFNMALAKRLRGRGFCWEGIKKLTNTSANYWFKKANGTASSRSEQIDKDTENNDTDNNAENNSNESIYVKTIVNEKKKKEKRKQVSPPHQKVEKQKILQEK